jgi:uncharacterized membrane protein YfcA
VLALEVIASLALLPSVLREVHWSSMRLMLAATVATTPIGILLLRVLPDREMRIVVAGAIFAASLAVASGVQLAGTPGRRTALTAGSVSGVVNGSTGIGGPPAVLLYFSDETAAEVGRATLIAYFLGTDAVGFLMMCASGLVDRSSLLHTALYAPLALGGIWVGQHLFRRTGGTGFKKVVLTVLLALSIAMLARALLVG